jgi:ribosomal protein S7
MVLYKDLPCCLKFLPNLGCRFFSGISRSSFRRYGLGGRSVWYRRGWSVLLYQKYLSRLKKFRTITPVRTLAEQIFFQWIFRVRHVSRFALRYWQRGNRRRGGGIVLRYERRTAPAMNLQFYALFAALVRHGNVHKAHSIVTQLIILLTENVPDHSGCKALYTALHRITPTLGLLTYRRGPTFFSMPVPLWPARRHFLAARFLLAGARRRQRLDRGSFLLALFDEVIDVLSQKYDCFTFKVVRHYQDRIVKSEAQAWRVRKRKF